MDDYKKFNREIIKASPKPDLPFSSVVGFGSLVFVSGKVGRDTQTGEIAQGDIQLQTSQALTNIRADLVAAGLTLDNTLKVTVFLTDMSLYGPMNEAYRSFFPYGFPARSCVGVSTLPDPEALIEIEVIAHR